MFVAPTAPRSRRFALATAVVIGLSACGSSAAVTSPSTAGTTATTGSAALTPSVIKFSGAGAVTNAGRDSADTAVSSESSKMMAAAFYKFVYGGDAIDLTTPAASWSFEPGATPSPDQILQIAKALGIEGDVRELSQDMGGGWAVGSDDYSKPSLNVGADATLGWWYNAGYDDTVVAPVCVGVETAGDDAAATTASDSVSIDTSKAPVEDPTGTGIQSVDTIDPTVDVAPVTCDQAPPVNVPTTAEAEAKATDLLTAFGLDSTSYEFETHADEWGASVTAYLVLDGLRTPMSNSFGFGENGALTWAGGYLATPMRSADYPRVGVEAAVDRLNEQNNGWGYGGWSADGVSPTVRAESDTVEPAPEPVTDATVAVEDTSVTEVDVEPASEPTIAIDKDVEAGPVETITPPEFGAETSPAVDAPSIQEPEPIDPIEIEPTTVTLADPQPSLEMLWASDGTVWLLPGYRFDGGEYGMFSVIAIEDQYIDIDETPIETPIDVPVETVVAPPVEPANPGVATDCPALSVPTGNTASPIENEDGAEWIGLCTDDAVSVAEGMGYTLRVVRLDGADLPATMDYIPTRFNVAVDQGIVTAIISIG
ncbi:MAG: hypothetical protein ABIR32_22250 [Ilumatobacteraceae bacterium]